MKSFNFAQRRARLAGCAIVAAVTVTGCAGVPGEAGPSPAPADSSAQPRSASSDTLEFNDSFDLDTNSGEPEYNLNEGLAARQGVPENRTVSYSRTTGVWYDSHPPLPWYSQVNHERFPDRLAFFQENSAVRANQPAPVGDGRLSLGATFVPATVTPIPEESEGEAVVPTPGNPDSEDWSSIVLTASEDSSGYITNDEVAVGVLVRANGRVGVYQGGNGEAPVWTGQFTTDEDASYRLGLSFDGSTLDLTVNDETETTDGEAATVELGNPLPESTWVYLGRYSENQYSSSTVDDLWATLDAQDAQGGRWPG